ncbi:hypothetical protein Tco_1390136, partial [Tanacetum coccineum]
PFEDPIETETLESPLTVAPPTSLPKSTSSTLVPILRRTACMVVRVPPEMSPGLSASMAEVAAMSESAFSKRFRSSHKSLSSLSSPDLPLRKRYQGTSELVEDDEEEHDEKDEEIEENLDSKNVSEDVEYEGSTVEDEDPAAKDEGLAAGNEGPSIGVEREEEEAIPEGQQQDHAYTTFEVGQGFESTQESERPERVSASRLHTLTTWTDPEDGMVYIDVPAYPPPAPLLYRHHLHLSGPTPATAETEGFLTELGDQVEMHGGLIRDHAVRLEELSPDLFESLEHEQERVAVTFGEIWRPVLALESWAGQTDAQRADMWHAISDTHRENQDLRLQLAEERRARLELAEVINGIRRGQGPRGDV